MNKHELTALAERVEAAEGPSRELDAEIKELVGDSWDYAADWGSRGHEKPVAKPYTASLDAAMTLVPEGYAVGFKRAPCQRSHAMLATIGYEYNASAATPALALVAAALKARGGE